MRLTLWSQVRTQIHAASCSAATPVGLDDVYFMFIWLSVQTQYSHPTHLPPQKSQVMREPPSLAQLQPLQNWLLGLTSCPVECTDTWRGCSLWGCGWWASKVTFRSCNAFDGFVTRCTGKMMWSGMEKKPSSACCSRTNSVQSLQDGSLVPTAGLLHSSYSKVSQSACLLALLPACLPTCLSACLPACLPAFLPACLFICLLTLRHFLSFQPFSFHFHLQLILNSPIFWRHNHSIFPEVILTTFLSSHLHLFQVIFTPFWWSSLLISLKSSLLSFLQVDFTLLWYLLSHHHPISLKLP